MQYRKAIFCNQCGRRLKPTDTNFCSECGARIVYTPIPDDDTATTPATPVSPSSTAAPQIPVAPAVAPAVPIATVPVVPAAPVAAAAPVVPVVSEPAAPQVPEPVPAAHTMPSAPLNTDTVSPVQSPVFYDTAVNDEPVWGSDLLGVLPSDTRNTLSLEESLERRKEDPDVQDYLFSNFKFMSVLQIIISTILAAVGIFYATSVMSLSASASAVPSFTALTLGNATVLSLVYTCLGIFGIITAIVGFRVPSNRKIAPFFAMSIICAVGSFFDLLTWFLNPSGAVVWVTIIFASISIANSLLTFMLKVQMRREVRMSQQVYA